MGNAERTLVIVKPDAVGRRLVGAILDQFEGHGLAVVEARMVRLAREEAERFYEVHRGRPFFESLVRFMTSGPCLAAVLEGDDAVRRVRAIMGATDPAEAAPGTIRRRFAESKERNCVHGSDSPENAAREIAFFFP